MRRRTGYLFRKRPGGNYFVRTIVDGRPIVRSTGTASRREAERRRSVMMQPYALGDEKAVLKSIAARLQETEADITRAQEERDPPTRIDQVWEAFLASPARPDSGEATLRQYEAEWRRFRSWLTREHPGIEYLREVTSAMAAGYARDLTAAKVSASTFNQHRNLLRMVWRILTDDARLETNPWDKIATRKRNALANRKLALTAAQYGALLAAVEADPDLRDLFVLFAWTGLRRADAVLLKWSAVDFNPGVLTVAPVKTARRQGKLVHVPLFPAALEVLNRRQEGKVINPAGFVFPALAALYQRDPTTLGKRIREAFIKAGLETNESRTDRGRNVVLYGAHSFRHLFVTAAASAGMPAAMIKSITGHATDTMLEHYQQMGVGLASEMARRIGKGSASLLAPTTPRFPVEKTEDQLSEIHLLASGMTPRTWKTVQQQILALCRQIALPGSHT